MGSGAVPRAALVLPLRRFPLPSCPSVSLLPHLFSSPVCRRTGSLFSSPNCSRGGTSFPFDCTCVKERRRRRAFDGEARTARDARASQGGGPAPPLTSSAPRPSSPLLPPCSSFLHLSFFPPPSFLSHFSLSLSPAFAFRIAARPLCSRSPPFSNPARRTVASTPGARGTLAGLVAAFPPPRRPALGVCPRTCFLVLAPCIAAPRGSSPSLFRFSWWPPATPGATSVSRTLAPFQARWQGWARARTQRAEEEVGARSGNGLRASRATEPAPARFCPRTIEAMFARSCSRSPAASPGSLAASRASRSLRAAQTAEHLECRVPSAVHRRGARGRRGYL